MKISKEHGPKRQNPYPTPDQSQAPNPDPIIGIVGNGKFARGDGGGTYFYAVYPADATDQQIRADFVSKSRLYCLDNNIPFEAEYWTIVANNLQIGTLKMGKWQTETEL